MTAKEYLEEYRSLVRKRKLITKRIEDIDNEIISIGGVNYGDKVKSSPKNDPIGEVVIQLVNKKASLGLSIIGIKAKEAIYEKQIMKMQETDEKYFEILVYRYMFGYDWKEICDTMQKGRSQVNVFHGEALKIFDEMWQISKSDKIGQNRTKLDNKKDSPEQTERAFLKEDISI